MGSPRDLIDVSGNFAIGQAFTYTAFGDLVNGDGTAYSGTPNTNYLYTGQQFDSATNLYSLRARYYNPSDGRFLSCDTWMYDFQNPVELNRYGYTANNPINYTEGIMDSK